jgi:hypothetical protein
LKNPLPAEAGYLILLVISPWLSILEQQLYRLFRFRRFGWPSRVAWVPPQERRQLRPEQDARAAHGALELVQVLGRRARNGHDAASFRWSGRYRSG